MGICFLIYLNKFIFIFTLLIVNFGNTSDILEKFSKMYNKIIPLYKVNLIVTIIKLVKPEQGQTSILGERYFHEYFRRTIISQVPRSWRMVSRKFGLWFLRDQINLPCIEIVLNREYKITPN